MEEFWLRRLQSHLNVITTVVEDSSFLEGLSDIAKVILTAYKSGNKLLFCGNGGSAADAQHLAAELVGRFYLERGALNAEALTVNTSSLTAIGNDYGYDTIFSRQLEAKGKPGDVLIGLSTSGNSINIAQAISKAKEIGIVTVGMTGEDRQSQIARLADFCIYVPSKDVPRIQEAHILIGHMLCEFVESSLFGSNEA